MEGLLADTADEKTMQKFKEQYLQELSEGSVSNHTKFEYSWSLISSKSREDIQKGIDLLEELCYTGDNEAKRDYLFYLSIANTKIGDYSRAMECNQRFLEAEPTNYQALELQAIIKQRMTQKGLQGMAIVGGTAAVVVVGVGAAVVTGLVSAALALKRRYT